MAEQELTKEERLALARIDKEVLAQARAAREQEVSLRKIEADRQVQTEKVRASMAADRRQRRGYWGVGIAVVIVLLAVIAAIWTGVDRSKARDVQIQETRQKTAQACIAAGNIWLEGQGCLLTQKEPS